MWIVFRLVLALIGLVVRMLARRPTGGVQGHYQGMPYFEDLDESKRRTTGFKIGATRRSPTWVRLHAESALDRWFKRAGLASECQTGDARFDDVVYVASDHPRVAEILGGTPELRDAIRDALVRGFDRVEFDGRNVTLRRKSDRRPTDADKELLFRIHAASERLEDEVPRRLADPFLWRALFVEGLIWSAFGYAAGGVVEAMVSRADVHVRGAPLVWLGLFVAAVAFVLLGGLIAMWMRGSSRGHRVLVESAVVLALSLPFASIQAVADANRTLDDAPPTVVSRIVDQAEVRSHRGRRGRKWHSYHLTLRPGGEPELPETIEVDADICRAASPGSAVDFEIGPGRFGIPWYRRISVGAAEWVAPR